MESEKLDILCFGAHPDDVEIGMAGTIRKHVDLGFKVGICDLTLAELSSNGTVETRQKEAAQAGHVLGLELRLNLELPDRGLNFTRDKINKIVQIIRTYKPSTVFLPYEDDRHPDHGNATKLVEEAIFSANIRKFQSGEAVQEPHKVSQVYYYMINGFTKPHVLVDITEYMEVKKESLVAYQSQFRQDSTTVKTRLNTEFFETIEGRERVFGKMIDVSFAEGFVLKEPLQLKKLLSRED